MITNYGQMPLGVFIKVAELFEKEQNENARNIAILALLTGKSEDEILALPFEDYMKLAAQAGFIYKKIPTTKVPHIYEFGKWRLIPMPKADNLIGEVTALQMYNMRAFAGKAEFLAELLACYLIPEGHTYGKGYDLPELCEDIRKHLTASDMFSLLLYVLVRMRTETQKAIEALSLHTCDDEEAEKTRKETIETLKEVIKNYNTIIEQNQ